MLNDSLKQSVNRMNNKYKSLIMPNSSENVKVVDEINDSSPEKRSRWVFKRPKLDAHNWYFELKDFLTDDRFRSKKILKFAKDYEKSQSKDLIYESIVSARSQSKDSVVRSKPKFKLCKLPRETGSKSNNQKFISQHKLNSEHNLIWNHNLRSAIKENKHITIPKSFKTEGLSRKLLQFVCFVHILIVSDILC